MRSEVHGNSYVFYLCVWVGTLVVEEVVNAGLDIDKYGGGLEQYN